MQRHDMKHGRQFLLAALLAAAATLGMFTPLPAAADAPPRRTTQVPGYYRMMLGRFEVTALYDGYTMLPAKVLMGASAATIHGLLARMFVSWDKGMQTAVNGFLINTGQHLVLVDAGGGKCLGSTLGHLVDNLRAAGYQPAQVDAVLLTHLHGDHVCGISDADGKPVFPNASISVSKDEAGYWLDKDKMVRATKEKQPAFKRAQDAVAPYVAAGRMKEFKPGDALLPGIVSVAEPGHTPGHAGYLFSSGGRHLLVWGDIIHSHAVQFGHPQVAIAFDSDQKQAIATREKILADAARNKLWIAGAHLPFPGIGHVRPDLKTYAWVPVEYAPLPP